MSNEYTFELSGQNKHNKKPKKSGQHDRETRQETQQQKC